MGSTRRTLLKRCSIVATALGVPGISGASSGGNPSDSSLRLRGTVADPLSISEIHRKKRRLLSELPRESVPDIRAEDLSGKDKPLAYNFDIIDGAPSEWMGVHYDEGKRRTEPAEIEERIHRKAAESARRRRRAKSRRATGTETEGDGVVTTSSTTDDWGNWFEQAESRGYKSDNDGNEMGWTSYWKKDPDNNSNQGLETEVRMRPYNTGLRAWENSRSEMKFDYNGTTFDYVSDYGPGNSIGSNTSAMELSMGSDGVLGVSYSSSVTSSNLDIDNKSNTDSDDYVKHKYDISGDLRYNTVRVNQSAVTRDTDPTGDTTYCNQSMSADFAAVLKLNTISNSIRVYWT